MMVDKRSHSDKRKTSKIIIYNNAYCIFPRNTHSANGSYDRIYIYIYFVVQKLLLQQLKNGNEEFVEARLCVQNECVDCVSHTQKRGTIL